MDAVKILVNCMYNFERTSEDKFKKKEMSRKPYNNDHSNRNQHRKNKEISRMPSNNSHSNRN